MFLHREASSALASWLHSNIRKPLVIRGARQVGKTALVRHFAQSEGKHLLELNFERRPEFISLFDSNDPKEIMFNVESFMGVQGNTSDKLLFLDEIQVAPQLLAKLRWFAEELPDLPVIAAGSLLEFVLADHAFSMPVGRINYLHIEPLSFEEYLCAIGEKAGYEWLAQYTWGQVIPDILHQKYLKLVKEYSLIGGMPAAVAAWVSNHSLSDVHQIHHELLATYRDDFPKYAGKIPALRLQEVLSGVPKMLGEKCIYTRIHVGLPSEQSKHALDLLVQARLVHRVYHSHANGVPLGAELKDKTFKMIYIDIGLASAILGLNINTMNTGDAFEYVNRGGLSEQFVGQMLRTLQPHYVEPQLYYWAREEKGSPAEIDYLVQHASLIMPVEVKAGSTGSLKSLHMFMSLKNLEVALRINSDFPSITEVSTKLYDGSPVAYQLRTLPFYLVGQLHRLLSIE